MPPPRTRLLLLSKGPRGFLAILLLPEPQPDAPFIIELMASSDTLKALYNPQVGSDHPAAEVQAIRAACGVFDMRYRARLAATGPDKVRWLNGMVTNNIKNLAPDRGVYNFLLNAQGHILGDLYVYNLGEHMLLETDQSQLEKVQATLDRFIIMDDVELQPLAGEIFIGLKGPNSAEVLATAGMNVAELEVLQLQRGAVGNLDLLVIRLDDSQFPSYEISAAVSDAPDIWNALLKAGATPVGTAALEIARILEGTPRFAQDIRERDLPQETGQSRALDFTKGCYIGQEIVERIHSRGNLHRRFAGFDLAAEVPAGAKLQTNGKQVGELTSVCSFADVGQAEKTYALGYIRREAEMPGVEILASDVPVSVRALPMKQWSANQAQSIEVTPDGSKK